MARFLLNAVVAASSRLRLADVALHATLDLLTNFYTRLNMVAALSLRYFSFAFLLLRISAILFLLFIVLLLLILGYNVQAASTDCSKPARGDVGQVRARF